MMNVKRKEFNHEGHEVPRRKKLHRKEREGKTNLSAFCELCILIKSRKDSILSAPEPKEEERNLTLSTRIIGRSPRRGGRS